MLLTVLGYVLGVLGLTLTTAVAMAWRAYLVELHGLAVLALLGGYILLREPTLPVAITASFAGAFAFAGGLAVLRLWLMRPLDISAAPYVFVLLLCVVGLGVMGL